MREKRNLSEKEVIDLLDEREKEGVKFDSGKLRMDLLPPDALEALARILTEAEVGRVAA